MKPDKQIKAGAVELRQVMQINLKVIADSMIKQLMIKARKLNESKILDATKGLHPKGLRAYNSDLEATISVLASEALDQVRKEVPKAKKVKLSENEERLLFGEFENLPAKTRKRMLVENKALIGTQVDDLEKKLFFTFDSATRKKLGLTALEYELQESSGSYIAGNAVSSAASVKSARVVNDVRNAFFFDKETLDEIEAFEFVNPSPQVAVCVDLAGTIFSKSDPDHFRYTPPLHYNCRSYIRPIIKLKKSQKIEKLRPTKTAEKSIQFHESCCGE